MALCLSSPGITQAETEVLPLSRMPFISSLENPPPRRRQLSALCAHPLPSATTESAGLSGLCISLSNCHASRDRMRSFQTCPCDPGGRLLSLPARSLDRVRCSPCWGRPPPPLRGCPPAQHPSTNTSMRSGLCRLQLLASPREPSHYQPSSLSRQQAPSSLRWQPCPSISRLLPRPRPALSLTTSEITPVHTKTIP